MIPIKLTARDIDRCKEIAWERKEYMRSMVEEVAALSGVPVARILGPRKDRYTVQARQLCYYIAVNAGLSRTDIGIAMNRDHTSVTHGYHAECRRRKEAPKHLQALENIPKISGPGGATNANPGPDHGNLCERSDAMANAVIIPIPGQNAITEVSPR